MPLRNPSSTRVCGESCHVQESDCISAIRPTRHHPRETQQQLRAPRAALSKHSTQIRIVDARRAGRRLSVESLHHRCEHVLVNEHWVGPKEPTLFTSLSAFLPEYLATIPVYTWRSFRGRRCLPFPQWWVLLRHDLVISSTLALTGSSFPSPSASFISCNKRELQGLR